MKLDIDKINPLLARLVDETISRQEMTELESLLDNNPEAQRYYLQYIGLHEDLADQPALTDSIVSSHRFNTIKCIAALIAVLAICAAVYFGSNPKPVAELVDFEGPVRVINQDREIETELRPGFAMQKGWIKTMGADSWVEIQFQDQTTIQISGMAKLHVETLRGQKQLNLTNGSISVDAAPQPAGKPMLLMTAAAEAEVLGTQFNVVANDFSTRLEVNEGLVKVKRLADGQTEEVKPNHEVMAALESGTRFVARQRTELVSSWESQLPRDILQGSLTTNNTVKAKTHLWRGDVKLNEVLEKPVLLHTVVLDPSAAGQPRVRLVEGSRLLIRGVTRREARLHMGFSTNKWNGGFSGKYGRWQKVTGQDFELEIPIEDFKPKRSSFPGSPIGEELVYLWVQTVEEDKGLQIKTVQLID